MDAGDHIQGTAYGSMDDGETIIKLMSEAGYDLATPGNHEFDYGMARAKAAMKEAAFPYVSCNWVDLRTNLRVLPEIKVFVRGGVRIAFVGITTPETFTKSTPAYFMNKAQTKYIYDILGGEDGQKLYDAVQEAIDKAEFWGADTIIGLGHLGVDPSSSPWTSEEVIAHTHGFTAFIDGHSHTVMANKQVTDASGKAVTLTQTGSYFKNIGKMTVGADGTITTELIDTYEGLDAAVAATASNWISAVDDMLGEEIAVGDTKFYINDPATGKRRIRSGETNLGDFVADGIYTYFNEVEQLHCDIAIMNGGGIRTEERIETYLSLGVGRCILGSVAVTDFDFTARMLQKYGDKIAVGVDAKDGYVAIHGWKEVSAEPGVDFCKRLAEAGCTAIIYTDIACDGAMQGTNLALYRQLQAEVPGVAFTASGGISSEAELEELDRMGVAAAILGKSLYTGALDLKCCAARVQR